MRDVIPGLAGDGVLYADPADYDDIALALIADGYSIHAVDGRHITNFSEALPAVADALSLPGAADRSLDAMFDSLRDLAQWCPEQPRIVLLWRHAETLMGADASLWSDLVEVLDEASRSLWQELGDDVAFETIAFAADHSPRLGLGYQGTGR